LHNGKAWCNWGWSEKPKEFGQGTHGKGVIIGVIIENLAKYQSTNYGIPPQIPPYLMENVMRVIHVRY
jgi:hypothetical protein